jgi:hypothetical protein
MMLRCERHDESFRINPTPMVGALPRLTTASVAHPSSRRSRQPRALQTLAKEVLRAI